MEENFESAQQIASKASISNQQEQGAKVRTPLENQEKLIKVLAPQLPKGMQLGKAYDQGDCFFDALAQLLNSINNTDLNSAKYLRTLCHEFYLNNKALVDQWNVSEYGGLEGGRDDYYFVQYTAEECEQHFKGRAPIWGRPNIEGKILCHQLQLEAICVIEILEDPETQKPVPSFHRVNQNDYKGISEEEAKSWLNSSKIPTIVVEQNSLHFVPLLDKAADASLLKANNNSNIQSYPLEDVEPSPLTNQSKVAPANVQSVNILTQSHSYQYLDYVKRYRKKYMEVLKAIEDVLKVITIKRTSLYQANTTFLQNLKAELIVLKVNIDTLDSNNFAQLLYLQHSWQLLQESVQDQLNELEATVNSRDKTEQFAKKYLTEVLSKLKQTFEFNVLATEFYAATAQQLIQEAFASTHQAIRQLTLAQPKCFISYAWGITEHEQLATKLAAHLQLLGFEVWLDRWSNPAGAYIDYFTTKIGEADYVLLLGSKKLVAKYNEGQALYDEVQAKRQQLDFSQNNTLNHNYIVNVELHQIFSKGLHSPGAIVPLLLDGTLLECLPPNDLRNVVPIHLTEHRDTKIYSERLFELVQVLLPNATIKTLVDTQQQILVQRLALLSQHVQTDDWKQSLATYAANKQQHQSQHQTAITKTIRALIDASNNNSSNNSINNQDKPNAHSSKRNNKSEAVDFDTWSLTPKDHEDFINLIDRENFNNKIDTFIVSNRTLLIYGLAGIGKTKAIQKYFCQKGKYRTLKFNASKLSILKEQYLKFIYDNKIVPFITKEWSSASELKEVIQKKILEKYKNESFLVIVYDNINNHENFENELIFSFDSESNTHNSLKIRTIIVSRYKKIKIDPAKNIYSFELDKLDKNEIKIFQDKYFINTDCKDYSYEPLALNLITKYNKCHEKSSQRSISLQETTEKVTNFIIDKISQELKDNIIHDRLLKIYFRIILINLENLPMRYFPENEKNIINKLINYGIIREFKSYYLISSYVLEVLKIKYKTFKLNDVDNFKKREIIVINELARKMKGPGEKDNFLILFRLEKKYFNNYKILYHSIKNPNYPVSEETFLYPLMLSDLVYRFSSTQFVNRCNNDVFFMLNHAVEFYKKEKMQDETYLLCYALGILHLESGDSSRALAYLSMSMPNATNNEKKIKSYDGMATAAHFQGNYNIGLEYARLIEQLADNNETYKAISYRLTYTALQGLRQYKYATEYVRKSEAIDNDSNYLKKAIKESDEQMALFMAAETKEEIEEIYTFYIDPIRKNIFTGILSNTWRHAIYLTRLARIEFYMYLNEFDRIDLDGIIKNYKEAIRILKTINHGYKLILIIAYLGLSEVLIYRVFNKNLVNPISDYQSAYDNLMRAYLLKKEFYPDNLKQVYLPWIKESIYWPKYYIDKYLSESFYQNIAENNPNFVAENGESCLLDILEYSKQICEITHKIFGQDNIISLRRKCDVGFFYEKKVWNEKNESNNEYLNKIKITGKFLSLYVSCYLNLERLYEEFYKYSQYEKIIKSSKQKLFEKISKIKSSLNKNLNVTFNTPNIAKTEKIKKLKITNENDYKLFEYVQPNKDTQLWVFKKIFPLVTWFIDLEPEKIQNICNYYPSNQPIFEEMGLNLMKDLSNIYDLNWLAEKIDNTNGSEFKAEEFFNKNSANSKSKNTAEISILNNKNPLFLDFLVTTLYLNRNPSDNASNVSNLDPFDLLKIINEFGMSIKHANYLKKNIELFLFLVFATSEDESEFFENYNTHLRHFLEKKLVLHLNANFEKTDPIENYKKIIAYFPKPNNSLKNENYNEIILNINSILKSNMIIPLYYRYLFYRILFSFYEKKGDTKNAIYYLIKIKLEISQLFGNLFKDNDEFFKKIESDLIPALFSIEMQGEFTERFYDRIYSLIGKSEDHKDSEFKSKDDFINKFRPYPNGNIQNNRNIFILFKEKLALVDLLDVFLTEVLHEIHKKLIELYEKNNNFLLAENYKAFITIASSSIKAESSDGLKNVLENNNQFNLFNENEEIKNCLISNHGSQVNLSKNKNTSQCIKQSCKMCSTLNELLKGFAKNLSQDKYSITCHVIIQDEFFLEEVLLFARKKDFKLDKKNQYGISLFYEICRLGSVEIVKCIFERCLKFKKTEKAKLVNIEADSGWKPIMIATYLGCNDLVDYLIECGAHVNVYSKKVNHNVIDNAKGLMCEESAIYDSPIFLAVKKRNQTLLNKFLTHLTDINDDNVSQINSILYYCLEAINEGLCLKSPETELLDIFKILIQFIIEKEIIIDCSRVYGKERKNLAHILVELCLQNSDCLFEQLLKPLSDKKIKHILFARTAEGRIPLELLSNKTVDNKKKDYIYSLYAKALYYDFNLVNHELKPSDKFKILMLLSCKLTPYENHKLSLNILFRLLISTGYFIDDQSNEIIDFFQNSKDIDFQNSIYGNFPLYDAAFAGDLKTYKKIRVKMKENEQSIWQINCNGWTPLMVATYRGNIKVVNQIIEDLKEYFENNEFNNYIADSYINAQNQYEETALYFAITNNHKDIVEKLLTNRANIIV